MANSILIFLGITVTTYSVVFFLPTILKQLGWTSIRAQVMSIPVFIVAAVLTITAAFLSDYIQRRYVVLMTGCTLAIIGYAILFSMRSVPVGARYFAVYLITGGGFSAQTISIVWLSNNMGGHYKRAIGVAMQVCMEDKCKQNRFQTDSSTSCASRPDNHSCLRLADHTRCVRNRLGSAISPASLPASSIFPPKRPRTIPGLEPASVCCSLESSRRRASSSICVGKMPPATQARGTGGTVSPPEKWKIWATMTQDSASSCNLG